MKIAFLADPLDTQYAGIHVFCKELLNAIDVLDFDHDIHVFRAKEKKEFSNLSEVVIPIKKGLMLHHRARLFTAFPKYIKQNDFDIVVELAHFGPFGLPDSIKQVTYIHDLTPVTHKRFHGLGSHKIHKLLLPKILEKSHLILCNSTQTQSDIYNFSSSTKDKVSVVPLGISDFYSPKFDAQAIKKLKITKQYILHVGTLEPRKNIPFLIEAYEKIRKENNASEYQLVLVGKSGWNFEEIFDLIDKCDYKEDIILTDYVSKELLPILYTHAECLVMPSHYEGFGLPVLEAMACGCPCLLSGAGALKEVAADAALYFDLKNNDTLVASISSILSSQEEQLKWREKALKHATSYSWENTAKAFIASLESLAISS